MSEKAKETPTAEIFVVHAGKDYELMFADLDIAVEPHLVGDADLVASVENALELKAGSLRDATVKRPSTGRVLISGRASLG